MGNYSNKVNEAAEKFTISERGPNESLKAFNKRVKEETRNILLKHAKQSSRKSEKLKEYQKKKQEKKQNAKLGYAEFDLICQQKTGSNKDVKFGETNDRPLDLDWIKKRGKSKSEGNSEMVHSIGNNLAVTQNSMYIQSASKPYVQKLFQEKIVE